MIWFLVRKTWQVEKQWRKNRNPEGQCKVGDPDTGPGVDLNRFIIISLQGGMLDAYITTGLYCSVLSTWCIRCLYFCYIRRASISVDCWVDHPLGQGVEALNLDQSVKTNFQEQKKLSAPRLKRGAGTLTLHGRPTRTSVIQTILEANLFQSRRLRQLGWVQGFTI